VVIDEHCHSKCTDRNPLAKSFTEFRVNGLLTCHDVVLTISLWLAVFYICFSPGEKRRENKKHMGNSPPL